MPRTQGLPPRMVGVTVIRSRAGTGVIGSTVIADQGGFHRARWSPRGPPAQGVLDLVDHAVCAPGRPVVIRLDVLELERRFHRT